LSPLLVGASGWSYPRWKPGFYPAGTPASGFLRAYAERLGTVEINSTSYRLPAPEQFEKWAAQVPDGFRFAVKAPPWAPRRPSEVQERVRALGTRLGCVRLVITARRDDAFLDRLLAALDPDVRWALDLRHDSWDGVEQRLGEAGVVRVGDWQAPASWRYLRFREPPYDDAALVSLATRLRPLVDGGVEVLAYFRHEDEPTAPAYAERLLELVATGAG
jgi:uncharacterized protein YecE (DUF72 family)